MRLIIFSSWFLAFLGALTLPDMLCSLHSTMSWSCADLLSWNLASFGHSLDGMINSCLNFHHLPIKAAQIPWKCSSYVCQYIFLPSILLFIICKQCWQCELAIATDSIPRECDFFCTVIPSWLRVWVNAVAQDLGVVYLSIREAAVCLFLFLKYRQQRLSLNKIRSTNPVLDLESTERLKMSALNKDPLSLE